MVSVMQAVKEDPALKSTEKVKPNKVPFLSGIKRAIDFPAQYTPGPGRYSARTIFDTKDVPLLSKAGYYVVAENGKILRKKQPYFANILARGDEFEGKPEVPGPGSYSENYRSYHKTPKAKQHVRKNSVGHIQPHEKSKELEVGPGAYDAEYGQIKPRIKGVPEWKRSRDSRTLKKSITEDSKPPGLLDQGLLYDEPSKECLSETPASIYTKEQSSFASNVPRFPYQKPKAVPTSETISTKQEAVNGSLKIFIEKSKTRNTRHESPGPGHYSNYPGTLIKSGSCVFPKNPRFKNMSVEPIVGPGAYTLLQSNVYSEKYKKQVSGPFASNTKKELELTNANSSPGPANYFPLGNISDIIARKLAGNRERLGGLAIRFDFDSEPVESTPGPGTYMPKLRGKLRKGSPMFISKTKRSEELPKENSTFLYNTEKLKSIGSIESRLERGGGTNQFQFLKLFPTEQPIFQSSSPRFPKSSYVSQQPSPGPSDYKVRYPNAHPGIYISHISSRNSFAVDNYTPGPGSYSPSRPWNNRKSFKYH